MTTAICPELSTEEDDTINLAAVRELRKAGIQAVGIQTPTGVQYRGVLELLNGKVWLRRERESWDVTGDVPFRLAMQLYAEFESQVYVTHVVLGGKVMRDITHGLQVSQEEYMLVKVTSLRLYCEAALARIPLILDENTQLQSEYPVHQPIILAVQEGGKWPMYVARKDVLREGIIRKILTQLYPVLLALLIMFLGWGDNAWVRLLFVIGAALSMLVILTTWYRLNHGPKQYLIE
jgi:hypothetical protein